MGGGDIQKDDHECLHYVFNKQNILNCMANITNIVQNCMFTSTAFPIPSVHISTVLTCSVFKIIKRENL